MRGRQSRRPMVARRRDDRFYRRVPGSATHRSAIATTNRGSSSKRGFARCRPDCRLPLNDCPALRRASRRASPTLQRQQCAIDLQCRSGEGQARGSIHGAREVRAGTTEGGALRPSYARLLHGPQSLVLPADDTHDFAPRGLRHAQSERHRLGDHIGQRGIAHQADLAAGIDHVLAIALFAVQDRSACGAIGELA